MNITKQGIYAAVALLALGVGAMTAQARTADFWSEEASKAPRITTAPRSSRADAEGGEGVLEAFGTKYLPNAYALYQEKREKAKEREALLKENFPDGRSSDSTGGKLYDKIANAVAKAVAEMDRCHDVLCHYYLLHKIGAVTDAELVEVDSSKIAIARWRVKKPDSIGAAKRPTEAERTFAGKYLPAVLAGYDRLANAFTDGEAAYGALAAEAVRIDAVYGGQILKPLAERLAEIRSQLDKLADTMKQQKLLHAVEETTVEQLAEQDRKMGVDIQSFEKRLPVRDYVQTWLKNWTPQDVASLARSMVAIPGQNYAICKYEVTQAIWEEVMGENPSYFKGPNRPVERVSWDDCQEFIKKLNALPEVQESGFTYRLPTEKEWEYACRAGATGDYCKLADGTKITERTLGEVAWYNDNSGSETHPVGQKKPNAFGLYDMHGNVWEWCEDLYQAGGSLRVVRGGSWDVGSRGCQAFIRACSYPDDRDNRLGFRLAAFQDVNR